MNFKDVWEYHEAGLRIFGLHGADGEGNCLCGNNECEAQFKHPLISAWQHTPVWTEDQLDVMNMVGNFKTGFGVICEGLLVIDIDPRNGGDKSYNQLCIDTGIDYKKESNFVVRTGGMGHHIYFKAPEGVRLSGKLDKYDGVDFKSSGFCVASGSMHKSGNSYETESGNPSDIDFPPQALIDLLTKKASTFSSGTGFTCANAVTDDQIKEVLVFISPDCGYEDWVAVGMGIHETTGGAGLSLWQDWSAKGKGYPGNDELDKKWHSFGKSSSVVTFATVKMMAEKGGYKESVTFETTLELTGDEQLPTSSNGDAVASQADNKEGDEPISTKGVNLQSCTGLTGDLVDYINSNSRYPRENLAVAAALSAMGNIGGMSHYDDAYGVTANQFILCVAGSSTGKEAIQQSQAKIHMAAGFGGATMGSIKSEQEIIRGLLSHQANFYIVDEVGIFLQKLESARTKGGASYLEGVIGILMSAYSKADDRLLLSSDLMKSAVMELNKDAANCRKKASENIRPIENEAKAERLTALANEILTGGLNKPFLSLIGYTTPVTFNDIVNYETATNGFIGRSLITEDKETNPRAKRNFKKREMSDMLRMRISSIANGGFAGTFEDRIEFTGERTKVKTSEEAKDALDNIQDYLHDYAEHHKSESGLEAVVRRGFELVLKLSFVLAIGHDDKTRRLDDVKWAYAFVKRDLDSKIKLARANMAEDGNGRELALVARIESLLSDDTQMAIGQIANRCRKFEKEDVVKCLDWMTAKGKAKKIVTKHKGNGKETIKYTA